MTLKDQTIDTQYKHVSWHSNNDVESIFVDLSMEPKVQLRIEEEEEGNGSKAAANNERIASNCGNENNVIKRPQTTEEAFKK